MPTNYTEFVQALKEASYVWVYCHLLDNDDPADGVYIQTTRASVMRMLKFNKIKEEKSEIVFRIKPTAYGISIYIGG